MFVEMQNHPLVERPIMPKTAFSFRGRNTEKPLWYKAQMWNAGNKTLENGIDNSSCRAVEQHKSRGIVG
jgi:hypothetical protein